MPPFQTDPNYDPTEDSIAVSRNTSFQLNKLFLFIGGTKSSNQNVPVKLSALNAEVWTYMLSSTVTSGMKVQKEDFDISVFPNPTNAVL